MRLIDADELECISYHGTENMSDTFDSGVMWVMEKIDAAPTIDAVPVVRCRECKCYPEDYNEDSWNWCCGIGNDTKPNDFCSYGKRREDGDA